MSFTWGLLQKFINELDADQLAEEVTIFDVSFNDTIEPDVACFSNDASLDNELGDDVPVIVVNR